MHLFIKVNFVIVSVGIIENEIYPKNIVEGDYVFGLQFMPFGLSLMTIIRKTYI